MKRVLYIMGFALCLSSCNNESDSTSTTDKDSVDTAPVNDNVSNPNRIPGSNTPGEAMGNGDTASYDRMSQKIDSGK